MTKANNSKGQKGRPQSKTGGGDCRFSEADRKGGECKAQSEKNAHQDDQYRRRQIDIEEAQVTINGRIARYTLILTLLGFIGNAASIISAIAAKKSADVATGALDVARASEQADRRAWLKLTLDLPASDIPLSGMLARVTNIGKTPAVGAIHGLAKIEILDINSEPSFNFRRNNSNIEFAMMFPNDSRDFPVELNLGADGSRQMLSEAEILDLKNGKTYLAVYGMISYKDNFGMHWTRACRWNSYSPDPELMIQARPCVSWNAAGDGPPPMN
ncbi:MAG: hypothetical protein ABI972_24540 [Acidobacteriota bacterium]